MTRFDFVDNEARREVFERLAQTSTVVLMEILERGSEDEYVAVVGDEVMRILEARRLAHTCHAEECSKRVEPEMLMCRAHWSRVPLALRRAVWRHYRAGQCIDQRPSVEWLRAARAAIAAVAAMEGRS